MKSATGGDAGKSRQVRFLGRVLGGLGSSWVKRASVIG
jgi:hypothetical protein